MKKSIKEATKEFNNRKIKIAAQKYLKKFYTNLGFKQSGIWYWLDSIPHINMILTRND